MQNRLAVRLAETSPASRGGKRSVVRVKPPAISATTLVDTPALPDNPVHQHPTGAPATSTPQSAPLKASITDVLAAFVQSGQLSQADTQRAAELSQTTQNSLSVVLDRLGLISQADWARMTAHLNNLPLIAIADFPATIATHPRLSSAFYKSRCVVPVDIADGVARFAIGDPADPFVTKALRIACDQPIALVVATPRDIETALARAQTDGADSDDRSDRNRDEQDRDYLVELANDAPTIKLVDRLLASAIEASATDIHVEIFDRMTRVRYRIDGVLIEQPPVPPDLYQGVVSRLKILAGLDIAERRMPQDGRIRHRSHGREIDLRVATAPAIHGEALALRLLNTDSGLKSLDALAMPAGVRAIFDSGLKQRNGLILVTGPTGSGKTTTLHAALSELNTVGRKIVAVENPVEIQVPGIIQVESNGDIGLDFARALRSFLRHDPDVMMVGEIRDRETAEVAIQAALTGHLVLSTLHTNDAPSAVTRLEDMGIARFLIEATLRIAAAQRLVRTLCACARPSMPGEPSYRLTAIKASGQLDPGRSTPREPVGCPQCGGTGYRGRRAVFEAIEGARLLNEADSQQRYAPMASHAFEMIASGITSAEEALRVIDMPGTEHSDMSTKT